MPLKLHRTSGRLGEYILIRAQDNKVMSDAVAFFPAESEAGVLALAQCVDKMDGNDEHYLEMQKWANDLIVEWHDIKQSGTWGNDGDSGSDT